MNFEEIMLSEISQSQKNKWYMISLVWGALSSQITRERKQIGGDQELGEEGMCLQF